LGSGTVSYGGAGGSSNYNALGKDSNDTTAGGGSGNGALNGRISIYRLYNRALSDSEVSYNFNAERSKYGV